MKRLLSVLFWSVIAAAFIGPGTVTTAASAGAAHGYRLLWALVFSTFACLLLQEASARLTVVSGHNLGQALRRRWHGGAAGVAVLLLVLGAIVVGCAAYEAGNILGAVVGAVLIVGIPGWVWTVVLGLVGLALLWRGSPRAVALSLSLLVAVMGVAFLATAVLLRPDPTALLTGSLLPSLPDGSGLLVLGLVGTTVVPYNLFLGSGIAAGQQLGELRFGLTVAVLVGGLISMAVLVVGAAVTGDFGYPELAQVLVDRLGTWATPLFATGLCAAGLSSAVTAPLAAAVTAKSLFARDDGEAADPRWTVTSWRYRSVWLAVLATGLLFGLSGVHPVPVILLAQALNGLLLPLVAVFLLLAVNDRHLMGEAALNGPLANALTAVVVWIALVLGLTNLGKAAVAALGLPAIREGTVLVAAAVLALALAYPLQRAIRRGRRG